MSTEQRTHPQRLRSTSLDTRLIVAIAAMVLLSLLAANMAAFLILRDQLDRHSASSLRQGQRTATLVLAERRQALDAHVAVLSQRPTLRRFLAEEDFTALASFLDDFRVQSDLDWIMVCDSMQAPLTGAGEPNDASLCAPQSETGYRLIGDRPVLMARAMVAENAATSVVAGQWIDADFLQTLVDASSLEQSVIDPDSGRRLISTWPVSAGDAPALSGIAEAWTDSHHRLRDTAGVQYEIAYARMGQDAAPRLWLESALPVSERLAAERRILALLVGSTALAALVLIGVAVAGVRRVNEPVVDALRRSEDAVIVAQAERIAALESLDALIQSIVEGVIMADDGGTVRFASAGAERILKTPAERATGMALAQLLLLADGSPFPADDLLTNLGRGQLLDLRVQSGETITAAVSATRINRRTDEGQLNAYILRDVTEEEAHNRLRSYFLSSISHEFRTPLSTLKASLELLVGEENPLDAAESRQLLRPAYLSVVGLQTLIDNLLTSSTIEAGHFTLHLADADLSAILADAVRVVTPLLERRQQELIIELPAAPPIVRGDVAQLTQVLINLLTNASKYSPTGSAVEVVIAHHATQTGSKIVRVSVADEGPGIAPGERVEIFRRFVRHHDNEREQYGVGLGLYVAKTTIVAHGGRIDVEDRPGAGSIFWFELPVGE